jgi:hypothetical protein
MFKRMDRSAIPQRSLPHHVSHISHHDECDTSAILATMSVGRPHSTDTLLPAAAVAVARQALDESRLRGLPAAEEYRVIADRLYRAGFRDLPSGTLIAWIEATVESDYERLLTLRALGERIFSHIAAGDLAGAGWVIACELDPDSRKRLIDGIQRLNEIEASAHSGMSKGS